MQCCPFYCLSRLQPYTGNWTQSREGVGTLSWDCGAFYLMHQKLFMNIIVWGFRFPTVLWYHICHILSTAGLSWSCCIPSMPTQPTAYALSLTPQEGEDECTLHMKFLYLLLKEQTCRYTSMVKPGIMYQGRRKWLKSLLAHKVWILPENMITHLRTWKV